MKRVIKIFVWFIISLFILLALVFVFRNEILLQVIKMDQRSKMDQPYTMLELPTINDSIYQVLAYDYDLYAIDPYNYVISEFSNHDIIFLGENHRVKHDIPKKKALFSLP